MINTNVNHKTSAETISQIGEYFDVVDNCIREGDTNKRYTLVQGSNYGAGNVPKGSTASFILTPSSDNTADIKNAFITTELKCFVKGTGFFQAAAKLVETPMCTWVGFMDAFNAVEKYDILHNGQVIYSQDNAIEEGVITGNMISENTKKSDFYSYARHKDIWNKVIGNRSGFIIRWDEAGSTTYEVTIPIKIDIRRFLPLSNVRYLPDFIGKLELRVLFGTAGMVYCNCDPRYPLRNNIKEQALLDFPTITCEPVQIGDSCTGVTNVELTAGKLTKILAGLITLDVGDYVYQSSKICVPNFGISDKVYRSLINRYTQEALTFPTQTMHITGMNQPLCKDTTKDATYTYTPRFVDSIFLLFPLKPSHRTFYKNPGFINFELTAGAYGTIPNSSISFKDDPRMLEYIQQACNLNEDGAGFPRDVLRSLINTENKVRNDLESDDCTHFFVGFKVEPQETFQQGQTTNSPIDYTVKIKQVAATNYYENCTTPPRICFLLDRTLSFQLRPDGGPAIAVLDASDITTPKD